MSGIVLVEDGVEKIEKSYQNQSRSSSRLRRVARVKVANMSCSVSKVRNGFPGAFFFSSFIPDPFHQILKLSAYLPTIEDGGNLVLDFLVDFDRRRRRLSTVWNRIVDVRLEKVDMEDVMKGFERRWEFQTERMRGYLLDELERS